MQGNNSGYMNGNNMHMNQERFNNLQAQLQQHFNGGYLHHPSQNGGGNISGTGMVGIGGNMGNHHIVLSELPEPPISVNEIGPIPPPPMFSTPSPTMVSGRPHGPGVHEYDYDSAYRFFHYSHSVDLRQLIFFFSFFRTISQMMNQKSSIQTMNIMVIKLIRRRSMRFQHESRNSTQCHWNQLWRKRHQILERPRRTTERWPNDRQTHRSSECQPHEMSTIILCFILDISHPSSFVAMIITLFIADNNLERMITHRERKIFTFRTEFHAILRFIVQIQRQILPHECLTNPPKKKNHPNSLISLKNFFFIIFTFSFRLFPSSHPLFFTSPTPHHARGIRIK